MKRPTLIAAVMAITALAAGDQAQPPSAEQMLMVRVAFMMGSRGDAPLPLEKREPWDPRTFDAWDPTADNPELQNLLGLHQLVELGRATVTMRSGQRFVSLAIVADRRRYELDLTAAEIQGDVAYLSIAMKEDGRDVSRPRLGLDLGQKGVACARVARGRDEAFVFFVLQLDAV